MTQPRDNAPQGPKPSTSDSDRRISAHSRPWALVVGATLAYDAWLIRRRQDSLSRHFAMAAHRRPVVLSLGVGYLLAHLYGVLPKRGDAFLVVVKHIKKETAA